MEGDISTSSLQFRKPGSRYQNSRIVILDRQVTTLVDCRERDFQGQHRLYSTIRISLRVRHLVKVVMGILEVIQRVREGRTGLEPIISNSILAEGIQ